MVSGAKLEDVMGRTRPGQCSRMNNARVLCGACLGGISFIEIWSLNYSGEGLEDRDWSPVSEL